MTLPSQFSLEEENFYKDIQDLVKKGSQSGRELSSFLEQYKDLLARADLDDETFIINFAKAGLIIEASAKVYGIKVDSLWANLEHVLESLKNKGSLQNKKKKLNGENDKELEDDDGDDGNDDEKKRGLGFTRRKKKLGDALFSSDDFLEIDSITGLLEKNMNENNNVNEGKIKLCEKIPHMFIKTKIKRKRIDVSLSKCLDKDIIRLRDWIISTECLLVKEVYTKLSDNISMLSRLMDYEEAKDGFEADTYPMNDDIRSDDKNLSLAQDSSRFSPNLKDEKNNNLEADGPVLNLNIKVSVDNEKLNNLGEKDILANDLNMSRESDVARFSNVIERIPGDCLVDVDEVFWNPSKFQDVIPSKKRRAGKTNKLSCQACIDKKLHGKKGKKCLESKRLECLDSYFTPHVQPALAESQFGILPDEELYSAYKVEIKLIEQLKKADSRKNANEAFYPNENAEGLISFLGFDGFENNLIKKPELLAEEPISNDNAIFDPLDDDVEPFTDDLNIDKDLELPFPVVENDFNSGQALSQGTKNDEPDLNDNLHNAESEYQKLVSEELKEHYAAKSSFAKNKELGMKISKWFEMIADKIKLSEKRGALNMKILSIEIMKAFATAEFQNNQLLRFQDLVVNKCQRDIPRYFFACLQLANERNLEIGKSNNRSLATDCMVMKRLTEATLSPHSNEHSVLNLSKQTNISISNDVAQSKRKRNSSDSSPTVEIKIRGKQKRSKHKAVKPGKRLKNIISEKDFKKRRCSFSSLDSVA